MQRPSKYLRLYGAVIFWFTITAYGIAIRWHKSGREIGHEHAECQADIQAAGGNSKIYVRVDTAGIFSVEDRCSLLGVVSFPGCAAEAAI
jgi:hypothetical protein